MSTVRTSFAFLFTSLALLGAVGCAEPEPTAAESAALSATPAPTPAPKTEAQGAKEGSGANSVTMCHGTEPFWNITIDPQKVTFHGVESSISMANAGPTPAHGFTSEYAALYQGMTAEDPTKALNVIITHADGGCSDGMSDEVYPFTVSVVSGSDFFSGCCSSPK